MIAAHPDIEAQDADLPRDVRQPVLAGVLEPGQRAGHMPTTIGHSRRLPSQFTCGPIPKGED